MRTHQGDVTESDEEKRHGFAENELDGADRADHDLFERTDFALADDGECSETDHLHQRQRADHAGDKEPAIIEPLVEPGARLKRNAICRNCRARAKREGVTRLIGRELSDDLADIAERYQRRVRVRSVHDYLKRCAPPVFQIPAETGVDDNGDDGPVMVDVAW